MGVYIKDMEMPKACVYRENGHLITCSLYDIDGYCGALNKEANHKENGKLSDCPLIELPPHGRLIDADALIRELQTTDEDENNGAKLLLDVFLEVLKSAPTIIEAEGDE